ncbi:MAG TPA: glycosyltransferase family 39 protein [Vicinamibacterales bacterium]|nr:glycosyltransferase family 39 protein [Vicinamibacterales bacterium]
MPDRLLSASERWAWTAFFFIAAMLLVAGGFSSADPDSALYAGIADRLAQEPVRRWIAPEWWGFWPEAQMTGLFREHPAGVFLMSAALTLIGMPAAQGAYVIGVGAGLASLLLMASLIRRLTTRDEARAALVLLQLMPVAFIFRIRANHEYPILVCLLLALLGLAWIGEKRPWWMGMLAIAAGLAGGLLIKGVFVVLTLLAIAVWLAINPQRSDVSRWRSVLAVVAGLAVMVAVAAAYDAQYLSVTGERFWGPYWRRQLGPLSILTPLEGASTLAMHVLFYISRVIWHPAPWSIALVVTLWRFRGRLTPHFLGKAEVRHRGAAFAIVFAVLAILVLSPASRLAERYAFAATFAVACAGVVAALREWPAVGARLRALDQKIPALPATLWIVLILLRLGIGSWR